MLEKTNQQNDLWEGKPFLFTFYEINIYLNRETITKEIGVEFTGNLFHKKVVRNFHNKFREIFQETYSQIKILRNP